MDKCASAMKSKKQSQLFFHQKLVGIKNVVHLDKKCSRHKKAHQYISTMIYISNIVHLFITNTDEPEYLQVWCNQILPTKQGQGG